MPRSAVTLAPAGAYTLLTSEIARVEIGEAGAATAIAFHHTAAPMAGDKTVKTVDATPGEAVINGSARSLYARPIPATAQGVVLIVDDGEP